MGNLYIVRGSLTAGAAATRDFLSVTTQSKQRVSIREVHFGNEAAVAAQGVRWQLVTLSADVTGSAFTPTPQDQDNAKASYASAKSTVTANGTVDKVLDEYGFDILIPFTKRYPTGAIVVGNGQIVALRKIIGADTTIWAANLVFEE